MQKKAIVGIIIAIVLVGAIAPLAYAVMQRSTVTSLKFHFNKFELTDIDFSDTSTSRSVQQVFQTMDNPLTSLDQAFSLGNDISSITSPEGFFLDMVANTKLIFSMFVDVTNPSYLEAVIDRASVKVSINNRVLPTTLSINQQTHIPAGGQSTIELRGITLSGKEIADMLVNLATNDFVMTLDFGITSYFPTLLGDIPIPASLNLDLYIIPPKPTFDSGEGLKQVSYNTNAYDLSFANDNVIPLSGKFQVGVLKGNSLLGVDICDPACFPINSGIINFMRLNLGIVQVFEKENVSIKPGETYTMNINNPELRNKEQSAFIIRWNPDYDKIPYVMHTEIAGVQSDTQGEFSSQSLTTVKKIAYNLVRDFGYVGSKEFESPDTSTFLTLASSASSATAGSEIHLTGRLTDLTGTGIANSQVVFQDDDPLSGDDFLGSVMTDSQGEYSYFWTAKTADFLDITVDLFASYDGSTSFSSARSQTIHLDIQGPSTPDQQQKIATILSFETSSTSAYENDRVTFTGRLTTPSGIGISDALIQIKDEDAGSVDDEIANVRTGTDGSFTVYWDARPTDPFDRNVESFADYDGDNYYLDSRSEQIDIAVYEQQQVPPQQQQATTISLLASSTIVDKGDIVELSGTLVDESGQGVSGATIYIKDEDSLSGDDLISIITTDLDGNYAYEWSAEPRDPFDNIVEVFAVFEGSSLYGQARSVQINIQVN